jgi:hypothetical protein
MLLLVKDAWKVGKAKCKIVDVKFITDCFVTTKPKLVLEKTYLLAKILAEERKKRTTSVRPESKGLPKPGGLEETIEPRKYLYY